MRESKVLQVIIRDDDINYFTSPEELNFLYAPLWEAGKPICLAVVPFASPDVPGWEPGRFLTIAENLEICAFLNEKVEDGLLEIALHGHSHLPGEYDTTDEAHIFRLFQEGLEVLRRAFPAAKIRTFIPPHGRLSALARDFFIAQGFNICTTSVNLAQPGRFGWLAFRLKRWLKRPGFHPALRQGKAKLFPCDEYLFSPNKKPEECLRRAEKMAAFCAKWGRPLICTNHYWHFSEPKNNALLAAWYFFFKGLMELGEVVSFTTFSRYKVPPLRKRRASERKVR